MNKEEARAEYEKIIRESNQKELDVIAKAKAEGIWKKGLDSNKDLLKGIKEETRRKIEALNAQIIN